MKVLLATPPWKFSEIYPASMSRTSGPGADRFGTITGATEPLGMLYLSAVLREAGHRPQILDGFGMQPKEWFARIAKEKPDLFGMTLSAFSWSKSVDLIPAVKKMLPDLPIVAGGPYPTAVGKAALKQLLELDYAVRGAGERAIVQLCDAIASGKSVAKIAGLSYRRGTRTYENIPATDQDLDSLPFPARDIIDMTRYKPSVGFYNKLPSASMMTTRGCPRKCKFCVSSTHVQYRSIENVMAEIDECEERYGIRHVLFWDEDIAVKKSRAIELCEALARRKRKISWCASMTPASAEPELLKLMKKAGCWKLLFGVETGVQKNLEVLGKQLDLERVGKQLANVKKAGIETFATFMFGIPGETREEAEATIRYACSLPLDYALFLNLTPFPGTALYNNMDEYGTFQGIWSTQSISFVPHSMTLQDLKDLRALAYRRFYLRPGYVLRRGLRMRSREDFSRNVRGLIATLGLTRK
jgi:radical SAM superfamily enzyme YgiQ (UPF0313 family)